MQHTRRGSTGSVDTAGLEPGHFGAARLCLLVTFVLMSGLTYVYLDTGRMQAFLLMVQGNPQGTIHEFLVFYSLAVVLLFPCMILQVISGALYGFWEGLFVSWLATSVGQSLAFLLGRYLFRAPVKAYLHATWPNFPTIDAAIKQEGWKLVCLLRLSPVLPYNILNYALALTPVSFTTFSIASAVSTIPWTALYVYVGTFSTDLMSLARGKISYGEGGVNLLTSVMSMGFMVVTSVYGYIWSHRAITAVFKNVAAEVQLQEATLRSGGGDLLLNPRGQLSRGASDTESPLTAFGSGEIDVGLAHLRHPSLSPEPLPKEYEALRVARGDQ